MARNGKRMARTPVWTSIAATLESEIAAGRYGTGDKLPTEADLSARFGVNRHTVRRALAALADKGIVRARRGSGVFVDAPPADYPLGRRVRFHQNIRAAGREPVKQVLRVETRAADSAEAQALALKPGDPVVVYEGISRADGAPVSLFTSVFPSARLPGLASALAGGGSVTEALRGCGIPDYIRRETRITAERASATLALHLKLREGDPLLRTVGINTTLDGTPIEYGTAHFPGDRIALTVTPDKAVNESLD